MKNITERLDSLRNLMQSREFLEGKGLSNEVNIRIFCYDPKDEMAVRHFTEKLVSDRELSCRLIEYNLYDMTSSFPSATRSGLPTEFPRRRKRRVRGSLQTR